MTIDLKPWMTDAEFTLFSAAIAGKTGAVEYGAGGSTLCLANAGVRTIFSVESDPAWIRTVADHEQLRPLVASGALTVHHADIGPTTNWGHPSDRSRIAEWPSYWQAPWRILDAAAVDLVLVDGRFRVASALSSILHGNQDMTIAFHDFWNRPHYHVVLKYLNCACRADTLGIFFIRSAIDSRNVAADLVRYAFEPD
jgi:hypothetical protein